MSNFLADVGRADVLGQVSQTITAIDSMKRTESAMALGKEQIERLQRQSQVEKEEYEIGEQPIAIETLSGSFLGGQQGKMFQNTYNLAKSYGFIDMSAGGLGTIKKRYIPEMKALMSEPRFATQLSLDTIGHYRNNLSQIETQLAQKPDDQKLIQAKQQAIDGLNTSLGQNTALIDELKRQAELAETQKWVPTTREEALEFERAKKVPKEPETPTPMTLTSAIKNLSSRFYQQDALGNIITTPENQGMHRIAQKKLAELAKERDKSGKKREVYFPDIVNQSEDFARNVESRYWEYLDAAQESKERQKLIQKVNSTFKSKYGYIPKRKPR